jgi:periplasmic protein TonB
VTTENQQVFQAILQRPSEWRRLGGSTLAVALVYGSLLLAAVLLSERSTKSVTKIPAKLVVTLFDAPKVAVVRSLGLAGGEAAGALGGEEGSGLLTKAPEQQTRTPTPTPKAKVRPEAKALPNEKPKDDRGAGVDPKPTTAVPVPVSDTTVTSAAPQVGAASVSASTTGGSGLAGIAGGLGGAGQGGGSGGGGTGVGSGAGGKAGVVSGDTQVLPFMDGMTRPSLISKVDPEFTREARNANVQGLILTKCVIGTTGTLSRCRIVKGIPLMDQAVLSALAKWKYSPVLYQGKPTAVEYLIPVRLVSQ